jgi:hypothetical protein
MALMDLRTKRSAHRDEAIHFLLDAVARSHAGRGIALLDERGRVLAGAGSPREMWAAVRAAQGWSARADGVVLAPVVGTEEPLCVAAFGIRPGSGVARVAAGVARILNEP